MAARKPELKPTVTTETRLTLYKYERNGLGKPPKLTTQEVIIKGDSAHTEIKIGNAPVVLRHMTKVQYISTKDNPGAGEWSDSVAVAAARWRKEITGSIEYNKHEMDKHAKRLKELNAEFKSLPKK